MDTACTAPLSDSPGTGTPAARGTFSPRARLSAAEYAAAVNALIPEAEAYAHKVVALPPLRREGYYPARPAARWNVAYHAKMGELCREAGLRS